MESCKVQTRGLRHANQISIGVPLSLVRITWRATTERMTSMQGTSSNHWVENNQNQHLDHFFAQNC